MLRSHSRSLSLLLALFVAVSASAIAQEARFSANTNFGTVTLGQTSAFVTITATFASGGTVGSVNALTRGATGLDFAVTSASTCRAGQTYSSGSSCTVVATFAPMFAGARYGAVVLGDSAGNAIATGYIQGIGSGPQAAFQPQTLGARSFPYLGVLPVRAVAVDGSGDVFVGSSVKGVFGTVLDEIPAGCSLPSCVKTLAGTYGAPWGIAVDGAGNIFVADVSSSGTIYELPAAGAYSTVKKLSGNFGTVTSLTIDGNANIFLSDSTNSAVKEMTAASGYATVTTIATGFTGPVGIAVDSSGNLFVADTTAVKEILAVNGSIPASPTVKTLGSGILTPIDIKVDASGNVFVTDGNNSHVGVFEILAAGGYTSVQPLFTGFATPQGLAISDGGDLFVVDNGTNSSFDFSADFLNVIPRATA
jgi:hypothetical protein